MPAQSKNLIFSLLIAFPIIVGVKAGYDRLFRFEPKPEASLARALRAEPFYKDHIETSSAEIYIINFWASWCPPCIEETPNLLELAKKYQRQLILISISQDDDKKPLENFLTGFPNFNSSNIRLIWDDHRLLAKDFKVYKLPETFIFSKSGQLIRQLSGSLDWSSPEIDALIRANLRR